MCFLLPLNCVCFVAVDTVQAHDFFCCRHLSPVVILPTTHPPLTSPGAATAALWCPSICLRLLPTCFSPPPASDMFLTLSSSSSRSPAGAATAALWRKLHPNEPLWPPAAPGSQTASFRSHLSADLAAVAVRVPVFTHQLLRAAYVSRPFLSRAVDRCVWCVCGAGEGAVCWGGVWFRRGVQHISGWRLAVGECCFL